MPAKFFVDTNVLLRATVAPFPDYDVVEPFLEQYILRGDELWINGQVVREYFNQTTRPQSFMKPTDSDEIALQYRKMQAVFKFAYETAAVVDQFVQLLRDYPTRGKQVHDANLVATMLAYDIDTLFTINTDDMRRFSDKITLIAPTDAASASPQTPPTGNT